MSYPQRNSPQTALLPSPATEVDDEDAEEPIGSRPELAAARFHGFLAGASAEFKTTAPTESIGVPAVFPFFARLAWASITCLFVFFVQTALSTLNLAAHQADGSRLEALASVRSGQVLCPWLTRYFEGVPLASTVPASHTISAVVQTYPWQCDVVL